MAEDIQISDSEEDMLKKTPLCNRSTCIDPVSSPKSAFPDSETGFKMWTTLKSLNEEFFHIPKSDNRILGKKKFTPFKHQAGLGYQNFYTNKVFGSKERNPLKSNHQLKFNASFEFDCSDGKRNKDKSTCLKMQTSKMFCQPSTSFASRNVPVKDLVKFDINSEFLTIDKIKPRSKSLDSVTTSKKRCVMSTFDSFDLAEFFSRKPKKYLSNCENFATLSNFRDSCLNKKLLNQCISNVDKNVVVPSKSSIYSSLSFDQKAERLEIEEFDNFVSNEKTENAQKTCNDNNLLFRKGSNWLQSVHISKESNPAHDALPSVGGSDCIKENFQLQGGGFAEKALKLLRQEASAVVLWHHEKYLKTNEGSHKRCSFVILSHFGFHHLVALSCANFETSGVGYEAPMPRTNSTFAQTDINEYCAVNENNFGPDCKSQYKRKMNFDSEVSHERGHENKVECFVIVKRKAFQSLKLKPGTCINVYPPWQTLHIKSLCLPVLLCTHFVDVLHHIP